MGLSNAVLSGRTGRLERIWTAEHATARRRSARSRRSVPGSPSARVGGTTTVHLRGVETRATTLPSPKGAEYFGAEFRLGAYLPAFPPARLANLQDALLPTLPDGRIRVGRQGVGDADAGEPRRVHGPSGARRPAGLRPTGRGAAVRRRRGTERTAQSRFVRAVGLSRRKLRVIGAAPTRPYGGCCRGGRSATSSPTWASTTSRTSPARCALLIGYTPTSWSQGGPPFLDLGPAVPYKTARNGRP